MPEGPLLVDGGGAVTQLELGQAERHLKDALVHLDRDEVFEAICHIKEALEKVEDHLSDAEELKGVGP